MQKIKAIRNEQDYQEALVLLEELMELDPKPNTEMGDKLSLLSILIDKYEKETLPQFSVNAIDTLEFYMDQLDLKPVDLVPFIGSKSVVSEILSGKRNLTVDMIRNLKEGLGIPSDLLIIKPEKDQHNVFEQWDKKLFVEMEKRGYFSKFANLKLDMNQLVSKFFDDSPISIAPAFLRKSSYRTAPTTDKLALAAWTVRVIQKANEQKLINKYRKGSVNLEEMRKISKLSIDKFGPLKAQKYLNELGIILIVESHLPKTKLDGAVLMLNEYVPVIGITLRMDRLDNFWFTLMHELAHLHLHIDTNKFESIFDELNPIQGLQLEAIETEADKLASEALVPASAWEVSPAKIIPSPLAAQSLANEIGVDVSIIAGKIRYENKSWTYLNKIISDVSVREMFAKGIDENNA